MTRSLHSLNYQVQAFDLAGNTSLSSTTLILSTAYLLPPSMPTNVTATPYSASGITVSWSASQDPQGIFSYRIFPGTSTSNLVQVATVGGRTLSYKNTSLAGSTTYYYGVEAVQDILCLADVRPRFGSAYSLHTL